ncbi:aldose 1-epimerase family protein [Rhodococcus sp. NPDC056960]|uniref:aldose 1-epimerase family protein n=1 Tax=Rhodococcus sp. NPDC056960 TaxID=3345982 RepID=UPI003637AE91
MADRTLLDNGRITAVVTSRGAELCSLEDAEHRETLWQAGPQWPRHAPVLFPVIGRMVDDTLIHHGMRYPMPQHGFARDEEFTRVAVTPTSAHFRLTDSIRTAHHFPFEFVLDIGYDLAGDDLAVTYRLGNPSRDTALPASIGVHPAFRWPLRPGATKEDYHIRFSANEVAPIRRVENVLLRVDAQPTPVEEATLPLRHELFDDGAVILDRLSSTSLRYESGDGVGVTVGWHGFEQLAIWSPPEDTDLICIEPWFGLPSPAGFAADYSEKPAQLVLPPGRERQFGMRISLTRSGSGAPATHQNAPFTTAAHDGKR